MSFQPHTSTTVGAFCAGGKSVAMLVHDGEHDGVWTAASATVVLLASLMATLLMATRRRNTAAVRGSRGASGRLYFMAHGGVGAMRADVPRTTAVRVGVGWLGQGVVS